MKVDDYYPYVRGLVAQTGASRKGVKYTWESRYQGKSKNSLYDLFDQGLNGFVATGNGFIRLIILLGGSTALLSILYAVIQLTMNLLDLGKVPAAGIPTIIIAIFFFAGVQLFFLGVIGEYVGSIHQQVRRGLPAEITESCRGPHSGRLTRAPSPRRARPAEHCPAPWRSRRNLGAFRHR